MARAIWSGSISFGLLNVPVKLYSAVSRKSVSFRELRASDSSRIRHRRVAESDGEEVPYEEIVKGYEVAPEQYVVLTREELEELDPKKTRAIEIQDFVDLDEIDPIYFDHPYYLGPDKGAEKAYALMNRRAARRSRCPRRPIPGFLPRTSPQREVRRPYIPESRLRNLRGPNKARRLKAVSDREPAG